jgi:RimJ/RimL family protein N-acetyltransferase
MSQDDPQGDVIVPGELVYLGQVRKDLAPVYRRWLNSLQMTRTMGVISDQGLPMTDQDEEDWLEAARADKNSVTFGIYERESGLPVGNAGLSGVRSHHRSAEFGIGIGESWARGKGYGTEATRLVLDYGFTALGLHHIWLRCVAFNQAGIRAYEKAGFRESGRLREGWQLGGQQHDVIIMDILAREFESPVLRELLNIPEND